MLFIRTEKACSKHKKETMELISYRVAQPKRNQDPVDYLE